MALVLDFGARCSLGAFDDFETGLCHAARHFRCLIEEELLRGLLSAQALDVHNSVSDVEGHQEKAAGVPDTLEFAQGRQDLCGWNTNDGIEGSDATLRAIPSVESKHVPDLEKDVRIQVGRN